MPKEVKWREYILFFVVLLGFSVQLVAQEERKKISFDFYGDTIEFPATATARVAFTDTLSSTNIRTFYQCMDTSDYGAMVQAILAYKQKRQPDDWVFYQLIRRTAQALAPKAENYNRYSFYKWFLLCKSGYDATLNIIGNRLLIYVQSNDDIYDIPYFTRNGKHYICLNYHDYNYKIDFRSGTLLNTGISVPGAEKAFSYKLTHLPDFKPQDYCEKELRFTYRGTDCKLKVKVNEEVKKMFVNYPVVDYQLYFDAPLSKETYTSLLTQLKENTQKMSVEQGVEYLMDFTRYAFVYQADSENFGREKHMLPEQTLLYEKSDCADRASLFYCLVKELYHLPMIVVSFPHHLTIAVKFDKPVGVPIVFNGDAYSVCEPTPQTEDLPLGKLSKDLASVAYQVVYAYTPQVR